MRISHRDIYGLQELLCMQHDIITSHDVPYIMPDFYVLGSIVHIVHWNILTTSSPLINVYLLSTEYPTTKNVDLYTVVSLILELFYNKLLYCSSSTTTFDLYVLHLIQASYFIWRLG